MVGYRKLQAAAALAFGWTVAAGSAQAHFNLTKPDSWLKDGDGSGGPQKGSPCGPGGYDEKVLGVMPVPTGMVTTVHAGDMLEVDIDETIHHPGYFRISLAESTAKDATTAMFPDPPLDDANKCSLNLDSVGTSPHDNVLADGLFKDTDMLGAPRQLTTKVVIPSKPCEKCTLQVIQVMMDHGGSSCFYYHCADLKILAADGSSGAGTSGGAGSGAAGATGSSGNGASGMSGGAGTGSNHLPTGMSGQGVAIDFTGGKGASTSATGGTTGAATGAASGGMTGTATAGSFAATAGSGVVTGPATTTGGKKSGCSVVEGAEARSSFATWLALVLGAGSLHSARRRRVRARA